MSLVEKHEITKVLQDVENLVKDMSGDCESLGEINALLVVNFIQRKTYGVQLEGEDKSLRNRKLVEKCIMCLVNRIKELKKESENKNDS